MILSRIARSALLLVFGLLAFPAGASAGLVLTVGVETSAAPNGRTTYLYTVANASTSSASFASFGVEVGGLANLADIAGPAGWDVDYAPGDLSVFWTSGDEPFDLAPGARTVFSFSSPLAPGSRSYAAIGFEPSGSLATAGGTTMAPAVVPNAVPEPHSGALALVGMAAAAVARRVRRSPSDGRSA